MLPLKLNICAASLQSARDVSILTICDALGLRYKCESYHEYHLLDHPSLKIHPTKGWYWFSRQKGGNAIDFVMEYIGYRFMDALQFLLNLAGRLSEFTSGRWPGKSDRAAHKPVNSFPHLPGGVYLPNFAQNWDTTLNYLVHKRGIDEQIVRDAMGDLKVYESAKRHNCVFVAFDDHKIPKSAAVRSTGRRTWKGDAKGSIKRYAFTLGHPDAAKIHVFESAIDALSYMTLIKHNGKTPDDLYLSLDGTAISPLDNWLQRHPGADTILVHTDNDDAGKHAYDAICGQFDGHYKVIDARPTAYKDINETLLASLKDQQKTKPKPLKTNISSCIKAARKLLKA